MGGRGWLRIGIVSLRSAVERRRAISGSIPPESLGGLSDVARLRPGGWSLIVSTAISRVSRRRARTTRWTGCPLHAGMRNLRRGMEGIVVPAIAGPGAGIVIPCGPFVRIRRVCGGSDDGRRDGSLLAPSTLCIPRPLHRVLGHLDDLAPFLLLLGRTRRESGMDGRECVEHVLIQVGSVRVDRSGMLTEIVEAGECLAAVARKRALSGMFSDRQLCRVRIQGRLTERA